MQNFAFLKAQPHRGLFSVPEVAHLEPEKLVTFSLPFFLTAGAVLLLFFKCIEVFIYLFNLFIFNLVAEKQKAQCMLFRGSGPLISSS